MADPEVIRVMREFKASLLRGEQQQMQDMSRKWLAVERRLQGQMDALALEMTQVKQDGGTVSVETLMNQTRYRELMTQLSSELETYSGYVERSITDRQNQLVRLGIKHAEAAINAQGLTGGFNRLPIEAVEHLAGFASNGSPLNRLLMLSWPDAAAGLTQELITGIALGYNPRKTARMMAQGSTRSLDRMLNISRTESLRAYRTANLESYKASGVVTQYKRLATHDSRTCAACLMSEGQVHELDEIMPTHPSCRCTMVPIVRGLPSPQWKQGQEWFEEQDHEVQKGILGKERYYRWQNGEFDLGELVTVKPNATWGDTLQTTTLEKLTGPKVAMPVAAVVPVSTRVNVPRFGNLSEATDFVRNTLGVDADFDRQGVELQLAQGIADGIADVRSVYQGPSAFPKQVTLNTDASYGAKQLITGRSIEYNPNINTAEKYLEMGERTSVADVQRKIDRITRKIDAASETAGLYTDDQIAFFKQQVKEFAIERDRGGIASWLYSANAKDATIHEIAHGIEVDLKEGLFPEVTDFLAPSKLRELGLSFDDTIAARLDNIAAKEGWKISEYSKTNSQEYFAESFVAFMNGDADKVNPDLVAIFRKVTTR